MDQNSIVSYDKPCILYRSGRTRKILLESRDDLLETLFIN